METDGKFRKGGGEKIPRRCYVSGHTDVLDFRGEAWYSVDKQTAGKGLGRMKRIISLLLGILLLCGISIAAAEDALPYLEMFENDVPYRRYVLFTPESYPQVCISPYSASRLYDWNSPDKSLFVVFPTPPLESYCRSFYVHSANFEDLTGERRIDYGFRSSYWTFDKFLEKAKDPSLILQDGSSGACAYINPEYGTAHALIAFSEIETADKLEVTITLKDYRQMEEADKIARLNGMILAEVSRIQAEASVVMMDHFWTYGAYGGLRLIPSGYTDKMVTVDMPEITFHTEGETTITGKMFVTSVSGDEFTCYVVQSPGYAVSLSFTLSTWSVYWSDSEKTTQYTLSDGSEWGFCVEGDVNGQPRALYGSRVVEENGDNSLYLTVRASTSSSRTYWPNTEAFLSDLETVLQHVTIGSSEGYRDKPVRASNQAEPENTGTVPENSNTAQAALTGWQKNGETWSWYTADGTMITDWQEIDGKWYWFASDGAMVTGWQEIDGQWYWFASDGAMATGWQETDGKWYWFTDKGSMATGWQEIDGKWYWFASDGAMVTGQQEIDGKQELFAENGEWLNTVEPAEQAAETATQTGGSAGAGSENGGGWYYTEGGSLATGWKQIDNAWYFFEEDGSMATGWKKADDVWYYLNENGTMATGWIQDGEDWYYADNSGRMVTGWLEINGFWYYFHGSGKMDTLLQPFKSGDFANNPYYIFPGSISQSMGFNTGDAANEVGAAWIAVIFTTDYKVAVDAEADSGMLFEPNVSSAFSLVGVDGSYINLMVLPNSGDQAFYIFYDTRTSNSFSFFEKDIGIETVIQRFIEMCPEGTWQITDDGLKEVYSVILEDANT